jgi:hypothetical protein
MTDKWKVPLAAAGITLLVLAVLGGVGVGAYIYGKSTRQSDSQVDRRVVKAVAERSRRADIEEKRAVKRAKGSQRKADRKVWKKRMEKAVNNARNVGYSSGSAAGYSSGRSTGVEEGLKKGSDELTCSDDLDVPLPPCDL